MGVQIATLDVLTKRACFDSSVALAIAEGIELESNVLRAELATKAELKAEIADLRTELRESLAALRIELNGMGLKIEGVKSDVLRWMFGAMTAQSVMLTGIMYFMLQNTHR